jgi:ABC-type antimicrobial peptide transport system permease subunit
VAELHVEMRVHGDPLAILPAAQKVVQQMDPNLPLLQPMTQREQFETTISQQSLFARLAGFFGSLAVLLVATGLYGTLAYRVNNRTVEIGVRMALGARRSQVVWSVLRDSLVLTAIGVAIGIPIAVVVAKLLSSALFGVQPYDALSYSVATCSVLLVAVLASLLPARTASSVDPWTALRSD